MITKTDQNLVLALLNGCAKPIGENMRAMETPQGRLSGIVSLVANMLVHIADGAWAQIMFAAAEPCGTPGCQCEIGNFDLFKQLDKFRGRCLSEIKSYNPKFPNG